MKTRIKIIIHGAVQGVGFRPFIYRLASDLNLNGFVLNDSNGVIIEAESEEKVLDEFLIKIKIEKPPLAIISSLEFSFLDPLGFESFEIRKSETQNETSAFILPDIAVCDDCLNEINDPDDRRYLYPFTNCTNCGPRLSIIEALPYDRPNTSMKVFEMCDECLEEYEDPLDRRFHAQPIACPNCGPQLKLWDSIGETLSEKNEALCETINKIRQGKIVAMKGIGGFLLIVDATNEGAVKRLRVRKHRAEKPFALMYPSIKAIKNICEVSPLEEQRLSSPESPIILLRKKIAVKNNKNRLANSVAPNNPYLGIMLPYSPLHHLLMKELNAPIVATSGNLSDEPICIDEIEALTRLKDIADFYLVNNRPIVRQVDDSIARIVMGREMIYRRARGYAPLPIQIKTKEYKEQKSVLAVGGHLKNTVAVNKGNNIFISQHIGDLSTSGAVNAFNKAITDYNSIYKLNPELTITDLHPEYISTKFADEKFTNVEKVQHHIAHLSACRAENDVEGKALGVCWDGTGYGLDGTIWGGEFFATDDDNYEHVGQIRQFNLAGGDKAIKDCRRSALGLLYEIYEKDIIYLPYIMEKFNSQSELILLLQMMDKKVNTVLTSSAGRLFDGVSSLLNICHNASFEGQAAMMLEFAADKYERSFYSVDTLENDLVQFNWQSMIEEILEDIKIGIPVEIISARFHNTLVMFIINFAENIGLEKVILSGGCFQNIFLLEKTIMKLKEREFTVYWHQRIPTNDGGIAAGQLFYELTNCKVVSKFK